MDSPGSRPGGRARVAPPADGLVLGRGAHGDQFIRASRTNCQPAESSGMSGKGVNPQEQVPSPKCGKRVQRRYLRKHERSQHQGVRQQRHACLYCTAEICKTYSTFQDWKNHLHATHGQCLEDDDPLKREEYAAGFKLDRWERFRDIKGDETDRAYLRIANLRKHYDRYQGQVLDHRDHRLPSAFRTSRAPHQTKTSRRRSRSGKGPAGRLGKRLVTLGGTGHESTATTGTTSGSRRHRSGP